MNLIVAVDEKWGIGNDGKLLAHLPGDLKYFKEKTRGKTVVMGRKTLDSLPGGKPLPERTNIVLTRNRNYEKEGCKVVHSKDELIKECSGYEKDEVMIIGGASLYRMFLDDCEKLYVTRIFSAFSADTFFPNLDEDQRFKMTYQSPLQKENQLSYVWTEYTRI